MDQRIEYAKICAHELRLRPAFEVLVDGMANDFNNAFCAWPTCYYVLDSSAKLLYIGDSNYTAVNAAPEERHEYASFDVRLLFKFLEGFLD